MSMNFATNVVVNGENTLQVKTIKAPDATNSSTYSVGTNGQVLKSNGTSTYWGNESGAVTSVDGKTGAVVLNNGITFNLNNNDALLVTYDNTTITAATDTTLASIATAVGDLADLWEEAATATGE